MRSTKGTAKVLVIDHIELPTENLIWSDLVQLSRTSFGFCGFAEEPVMFPPEPPVHARVQREKREVDGSGKRKISADGGGEDTELADLASLIWGIL